MLILGVVMLLNMSNKVHQNISQLVYTNSSLQEKCVRDSHQLT